MAGNCDSRAMAVLSLILLCLVICSNNIVPVAEAIWLTVPSSGTKCVSEEIHSNVVVLADYNVINEENPQHVPVSVKVTSPYGNNIFHKENVTIGQFAFTTTESGNYMACFWLGNHQLQQASSISLSLDWKIGIAAKDWDSVARKEKIEGIELDLRRLKELVQAIRNKLLDLKDRDAEMREVSERTNARVAWFSVMSLGICIVASFFQLWFLQRYFQKKRLI